jgi:hypothetical protein
MGAGMLVSLPCKSGREYECKHGVVGLLDTSGT